nr:MAG TPA: hypothetical protein [Bacteriophage sp.]
MTWTMRFKIKRIIFVHKKTCLVNKLTASSL